MQLNILDSLIIWVMLYVFVVTFLVITHIRFSISISFKKRIAGKNIEVIGSVIQIQLFDLVWNKY